MDGDEREIRWLWCVCSGGNGCVARVAEWLGAGGDRERLVIGEEERRAGLCVGESEVIGGG